ncbi:stage II sporulation protein R [Clostridium sp. CAG:508]|jgi:stage II sporulation protein R|nr:stage II sporulation protein R [Clostridium sp. CAG:508]
MKKLKIGRIFVILILLSLFILISAISYVDAVSNNIADSIFRLHVIANSDSKEDQELKLKVRDELLSYMNIISKDSKSKQEAMQIANEHKEEFTQIAEKLIKENGYNYTVNVQIGKADFPTKYYGDITLPAGTYDALKVQIGEAKGQNWWCVMFPPLCFVDVSTGIVPDNSKQELKQSLDNEEYDLISKTDNNEISFKFKIVELFQNWRLGNK